MSVETIRQHLSKLKLYTAAKEIDDVLAAQKKSVPLDWLEDLLCRETDARHERQIMSRIKDAEFPEVTCGFRRSRGFVPAVSRASIPLQSGDGSGVSHSVLCRQPERSDALFFVCGLFLLLCGLLTSLAPSD